MIAAPSHPQRHEHAPTPRNRPALFPFRTDTHNFTKQTAVCNQPRAMNTMAGMPNMAAMSGPVSAPMNMMNNGALPHQAGPRQMQLNDSSRTLLNTYIYEYFVRYGMFDCARAMYQEDPNINVKKDSPGKLRDENGNIIGNGAGDDPMDTDTKDGLDQKRPDDLPAPNVPTPVSDSCFLFDWFCLFWDMFNSQKGKGSSGQVNQYVQHTQVSRSHIFRWRIAS